MNNNFLHTIEQIITGLGYECVNVSLKSDSGKIRLQILIDTLGGINVEDCELVSKRVNKFLDTSQDLQELDNKRYYLEVSSPGIERPLFKISDYVRFSGREARLRLSIPVEARKTFTGIIQGVNDDCVNISCEDKNYSIPFANIKSANLVYRFEDSKKNSRK